MRLTAQSRPDVNLAVPLLAAAADWISSTEYPFRHTFSASRANASLPGSTAMIRAPRSPAQIVYVPIFAPMSTKRSPGLSTFAHTNISG
jgi:hypothetical protein